MSALSFPELPGDVKDQMTRLDASSGMGTALGLFLLDRRVDLL